MPRKISFKKFKLANIAVNISNDMEYKRYTDWLRRNGQSCIAFVELKEVTEVAGVVKETGTNTYFTYDTGDKTEQQLDPAAEWEVVNVGALQGLQSSSAYIRDRILEDIKAQGVEIPNNVLEYLSTTTKWTSRYGLTGIQNSYYLHHARGEKKPNIDWSHLFQSNLPLMQDLKGRGEL